MRIIIGKKVEPRKFRIQITESRKIDGKSKVIKSNDIRVHDHSNEWNVENLTHIINKALLKLEEERL